MRILLNPPRLLRALLIATVAAAPLGLSAQTTAIGDRQGTVASFDGEQATIDDFVELGLIDGAIMACPRLGSRVLVKIVRERRNTFDGTTHYTCGRVKLDGHTLEVADERPFAGNFYYNAHLNHVATSAKYDTNVLGEVADSKVVDPDSDARFVVRSEQLRRHASLSRRTATMECPKNMAIIALHSDMEFVCGSIWKSNPPSTTPGGRITFRDKDKIPCSLPVPNGPLREVATYMLNAALTPCYSDKQTSIELQNVPSATRILLTDSYACDKVANVNDIFWIELVTIEKSVTMSQINIDELLGFSPGEIVAKGLKLVGYDHYGAKPIGETLSCVAITNSPAPPAS